MRAQPPDALVQCMWPGCMHRGSAPAPWPPDALPLLPLLLPCCTPADMTPQECTAALRDPQRKREVAGHVSELQKYLATYCGLMEGERGATLVLGPRILHRLSLPCPSAMLSGSYPHPMPAALSLLPAAVKLEAPGALLQVADLQYSLNQEQVAALKRRVTGVSG